MDKLTLLEQEITSLKARNARVELDKAWETSLARKVSIVLVIYIIIALFFVFINFQKPFINAFVPTMGFLLSTLSISLLKKFWIRFIYQK